MPSCRPPYELDILDRSIQALKACTLDDMHLAPRYATLLEVHVASLRNHFMVSASNQAPSQSDRMVGHPSAGRPWGGADEAVDLTTGGSFTVPPRVPAAAPSFDPDIEMHEISADDWLSLPFDPSMAPFPLDGSLIFPGQEGGLRTGLPEHGLAKTQSNLFPRSPSSSPLTPLNMSLE
jgi:hypothetical protein